MKTNGQTRPTALPYPLTRSVIIIVCRTVNILSPVSSELTHCWQNVCRQDNSFGRRLCTCSLHKPHRDSTAPKSSVDGTLSPLPADVSVTLSVVSASMPITGQSIYHQQITKKTKAVKIHFPKNQTTETSASLVLKLLSVCNVGSLYRWMGRTGN